MKAASSEKETSIIVFLKPTNFEMRKTCNSPPHGAANKNVNAEAVEAPFCLKVAAIGIAPQEQTETNKPEIVALSKDAASLPPKYCNNLFVETNSCIKAEIISPKRKKGNSSMNNSYKALRYNKR